MVARFWRCESADAHGDSAPNSPVTDRCDSGSLLALGTSCPAIVLFAAATNRFHRRCDAPMTTMHSPLRSTKSLPTLALLLPGLAAVACGGGGGGGTPPVRTSTMSGRLRMPEVAPTAASTPAANMATLAPMVPGEVVVWLEPGADAALLAADTCELVRSGPGPIAVFRTPAAAGRSSVRDGASIADSCEQATCDAVAEMAAVPGVRCASPNYVLQPFLQPNDTYYDKQWHYPQINLPQTWDLTQGSANVIVAVLDTGIVSTHPEFAGRLIPGYDMISDPASAGDGNGRDPNPEDVGDQQTPQGSSFHGTHVAGTIGANGNDGQGVAGVDWNCKLMPVRVLGRGGGTVDDIANGILFAARLPNASGALPAQRADIVNMSLGGPGLSSVLEQACNQAAAAGVLLVAAAGNDNSDQPNSPAAFDSVLSVGAVDLVRQRAPYSNFAPSVDLWAPGGDMGVDRNGDMFPDGVLSTMADDAGNLFFKFENGTSMASPHVAGVAALVKAANPTLTAAQLRAVLIGSATGGLGLPNGGRLVDALAAVQQAQGGPAGSPALVATPAFVDFGATATTATVVFENRGSGNLVFDSFALTPPAAWIDGDLSDATPANGIAEDRLDLTVDRTGLANGVYQTVLTLNYLDGATPISVDVTFRLQVGASTQPDDTVFVLLVDPLTLETLYQTETRVGANFVFGFGSVAAGEYLLVAGTDRDNDDLLGDEGELFGAWPSLDNPQPIALEAGVNRGALDFALQELAAVQSLGQSDRPSFRRLR